jgi:hypothetical protein
MLNNEAGMLESFFQMCHLHTYIHTYIHTYPTTLPALTLIILILKMLKFSEIVSFINKNLWRKWLNLQEYFIFQNEINYWMDVCPSCQGTWEPKFYAQDLGPTTISLMPMGRAKKRWWHNLILCFLSFAWWCSMHSNHTLSHKLCPKLNCYNL